MVAQGLLASHDAMVSIEVYAELGSSSTAALRETRTSAVVRGLRGLF